jgi:flagellar biosynthesis/type III secretory pathway ATPase
MPSLCSKEHMQNAKQLRTLMSAYARSEDLIRIGAYHAGTDPTLDRAIAAMPEINKFLQQSPEEAPKMAETIDRLAKLVK